MSDDVVIRAEGLGKKYVIGHQSTERVPTLRDALSRSAGRFMRSAKDMLGGKAVVAGDELEEFWALKDVNFEIKRGDVVGIIGRNGAGKSTLLKVLSRITEPTEGRVEIKGRVASLLEVGTGFHPELSGRENINLNGAILGMSRKEISRKFDEIVDFSEVEKFLDTPVKRYSSGMYVRLAFAVAAHLEPEILIVDEVLAVGDAEFQKKCLGKMQDVAGEGRTVLFVSHQMAAIKSLCSRGILLEAGKVRMQGPIGKVAALYETRDMGAGVWTASDADLNRPQAMRRIAIDFRDGSLHIALSLFSRESARIIVNFGITDLMGAPVGMASMGGFEPAELIDLRESSQDYAIEIPLPNLANGSYMLNASLERPYNDFIQHVTETLSFAVSRERPSGFGRTLEQSWGAGCFELGFVARSA